MYTCYARIRDNRTIDAYNTAKPKCEGSEKPSLGHGRFEWSDFGSKVLWPSLDYPPKFPEVP